MTNISFLSDFGHDDEFVGVVHGVIARLAPDARIIDVTHGIPRGNVRAGALSLMRAIQYLPDGVFMAVVDPGVGTSRRAIAAETAVGVFVGPDNGLLSPAVAFVGGASRIIAIENPDFRISSQGATFAGRDVFAPAAASLASGDATLDDLGPDIDSTHSLLLPLPEADAGRVAGEVWWVDVYGNAQTNISPADLEAAGGRPGTPVEVRVGAAARDVLWATTYEDVAEGEPVLYTDSSGLLALAARGGRGDETFDVANGTAVILSAPAPTAAR